MRRIDLEEITARYPAALEWFDTACPRYAELVTRFYERAVPRDVPREGDTERERASVELVAVATPERAHADGSGNLFSTTPIEARWVASLQVWVRHSTPLLNRPHEDPERCHATLPALTMFFGVGDRAYLYPEGWITHGSADANAVRIGTIAYLYRSPKTVRVMLSRDGVRELKKRGIPYTTPAKSVVVTSGTQGRPPCRAQRRNHAGCHACRGTGVAP